MRHEGSTIVIFGAGNIGRGFIGQLFARSGWQIVFVDVNRELYIHNLGHAITAYHGNRVNPGARYLWEVMDIPEVVETARACMMESARALARAHPRDFPIDELEEHTEGLLRRFANRALGDTVFRVGRDIARKIGRSDRIVGAMRIAARQQISYPRIASCMSDVLGFSAIDESGRMDPRDESFMREEKPKGLAHILRNVCGLCSSDPDDQHVFAAINRNSAS